jgi:hypothetical protein
MFSDYPGRLVRSGAVVPRTLLRITADACCAPEWYLCAPFLRIGPDARFVDAMDTLRMRRREF